MDTTFGEIFNEYYTLFRGQGTSLPVFGDREFTVGIHECNNAIRKWARTDGALWRELTDTLQRQTLTIAPAPTKLIVDGTTSYDTPSNMRKPPAKVSLYSGAGDRQVWFPVVAPHEIENFPELSSQVTFIGSANTGFTMLIGQTLSEQYDGYSIDYVYYKNPVMLSTTVDPTNTIIEMSDPNFAIQDMLASRFTVARNGFGTKLAKSEATQALRNMRIENDSGNYGNMEVLKGATGWGNSQANNQDIRL